MNTIRSTGLAILLLLFVACKPLERVPQSDPDLTLSASLSFWRRFDAC